ncbi:hypothetical protein [Fredinandcohnia sp. 179-A 10B2 NHS]|uniref:hypothetical protein n=1 Tax=Fredinandcohnia sp. 179-A 10B2 NHS TaxID=3235176 RepID=UPI0039A0BA8E
MVLVVTSLFSALIIFICVFQMIRVYKITVERNQLTVRKGVLYSIITSVVGLIIASVLPFGYSKIIELIL